MKKLYIILALVVVSFLMVFAGDTIKILRIYHNGTFTAISMADIDSVNHSKNLLSSIVETIDSTYNIQINEIDSVVVTEAEIEQALFWVEEIRQHLFSLEEQTIGDYQDNLLEWLSKCTYISTVTTNNEKDLIKVKFSNGIDFNIGFVDTNNILGTDSSNNRRVFHFNEDYIDVSYNKEEKIINKTNIMYIQCRTMPNNENVEWSSANSEQILLNRAVEQSPVNINLVTKSKSLLFIDEYFPEYGMVIISQTHGISEGWFQVEDISGPWWIDRDPIIIDKYSKSKGIKIGLEIHVSGFSFWRHFKTDPLIFYIAPDQICKKLSSNSIMYANYCHSIVRLRDIHSCTTFGFDSTIEYCNDKKGTFRATDSLACHFTKLLNGYQFKDAISFKKHYQGKKYEGWGDMIGEDLYIKPASNDKESHLRYFSILTKDITANNEIKGEIKGYKKLKKELKWILFAHEGTNKFTPKEENVKRIENAYKPDRNGNFTISSDIVNQYPNHAFIVGFEYAGKVYFGEMKTTPLNLCPNDNHPHMIDLGLPNGTKWACCNLGAKAPEDSGDFYAWGETEVHEDGLYSWYNYEYKDPSLKRDDCLFLGANISGTDYDVAYAKSEGKLPSIADIVELDENCDEIKYILNGIEGTLFTGKNGGRLFIPWSGNISTQSHSGSPHYWLAEESNYNNHSQAYTFSPADRWVYTNYSFPKYYGCPIRPIEY